MDEGVFGFGDFDGGMDSDGFDSDMDFDGFEGETDFDSYKSVKADALIDSNVEPFESLSEALEAIVDSDELFDSLPSEYEEGAATDVPLESLDESPDAIVNSDTLFDLLPSGFDEGAQEDLSTVADNPTELEGSSEATELDDPAEPEENPDYSFRWSGHEEHEFPEVENPKTRSRGYNTTPGETFHPAFLEHAEPEAELPTLEEVIHDVEEIGTIREAEGELPVGVETADFYASETDQQPDADLTEPENVAQMREVLEAIEQNYDQARDREIRAMARDVREFNLPQEVTEEGITRGRWEENSFILDDDFVPSKFNPEQKTISEIRNDLQERYGLELNEIPYQNGEADFSNISVAHLDADDIAAARLGMDAAEWKALSETDRLEKMSEVFDNRPANFSVADRLAAERGMEIPTLGTNYTKEDLEQWRKDNHFTWDEQLGGYHLVPSIIHGNLAHTGLVSSSSNAQRTLEDYRENGDKYTWDDADAPVSIQEVLDKNHN